MICEPGRYTEEELDVGPQSGWLGHYSLTEQGVSVGDFETYIQQNKPVVFTDPNVSLDSSAKLHKVPPRPTPISAPTAATLQCPVVTSSRMSGTLRPRGLQKETATKGQAFDKQATQKNYQIKSRNLKLMYLIIKLSYPPPPEGRLLLLNDDPPPQIPLPPGKLSRTFSTGCPLNRSRAWHNRRFSVQRLLVTFLTWPGPVRPRSAPSSAPARPCAPPRRTPARCWSAAPHATASTAGHRLLL